PRVNREAPWAGRSATGGRRRRRRRPPRGDGGSPRGNPTAPSRHARAYRSRSTPRPRRDTARARCRSMSRASVRGPRSRPPRARAGSRASRAVPVRCRTHVALRVDRVAAEPAGGAAALGDLGTVTGQREHLLARGPQPDRLRLALQSERERIVVDEPRALVSSVLLVFVVRFELGHLQQEPVIVR